MSGLAVQFGLYVPLLQQECQVLWYLLMPGFIVFLLGMSLRVSFKRFVSMKKELTQYIL